MRGGSADLQWRSVESGPDVLSSLVWDGLSVCPGGQFNFTFKPWKLLIPISLFNPHCWVDTGLISVLLVIIHLSCCRCKIICLLIYLPLLGHMCECVHVPPPASHRRCWSMISLHRVLEVVFEGCLGFQMHDFHDSFGLWIGVKNNLLSSSRWIASQFFPSWGLKLNVRSISRISRDLDAAVQTRNITEFHFKW